MSRKWEKLSEKDFNCLSEDEKTDYLNQLASEAKSAPKLKQKQAKKTCIGS